MFTCIIHCLQIEIIIKIEYAIIAHQILLISSLFHCLPHIFQQLFYVNCTKNTFEIPVLQFFRIQGKYLFMRCFLTWREDLFYCLISTSTMGNNNICVAMGNSYLCCHWQHLSVLLLVPSINVAMFNFYKCCHWLLLSLLP